MSKTILFGEPMALLIAAAEGPLEEVTHFERALSGAGECVHRFVKTWP